MLGKQKVILAALGVSLAACGGGLDKVKENQCPPVNILATADSWQQGNVVAQLETVELTCFLDTKTDALQAEVQVRGNISAPGQPVSLFAAALNAQDEIVVRTQVKVTPSGPDFALTIPKFAYGQKAAESARARVVVGFVLSAEQLAANRRAYAAQLGLPE